MIGVRFNEKHSYADWKLFLSAPPSFGSPEPRIITVEVPGRDGVLDYSEAATGEIKYSNRELSFVFATMIEQEKRDALMADIRNYIHGRTVDVFYDLDPDWYYSGRAKVNFSDVQSWKMKVEIVVDAKPYKMAVDETIITASPTSFTAETIFLGKGTAAQHINSIFEFGTAQDPQLDLTQFSKLMFRWTDDRTFGTPSLQINDSHGATYSISDTSSMVSEIEPGVWGFDLLVSNISVIDNDDVYRILCQGRSLVELYALTTASATYIAPVDRMTVVPVWTASANVTAFINGKKWSIPEGSSQDYGCRLIEGDNQVTFIADSANTTVTFAYRNGRL